MAYPNQWCDDCGTYHKDHNEKGADMDNGRGNAKAKHRANNPGANVTTVCAVAEGLHLHTVCGPTARLGKQVQLTQAYMGQECVIVVGRCQVVDVGPAWWDSLTGGQREFLGKECG